MSEVVDQEQKALEALRNEAIPLWVKAGELQYSILQAKKILAKTNLRLRKLTLKADKIVEALKLKEQARQEKVAPASPEENAPSNA